MAFSKDTIGFYLAVEDKMSPVLEKAVSNYQKFTKQLTDLNKQSYQQADATMNSMVKLAKAFDDMPKKALQSYTKTVGLLKKKMKPLAQRVDVVFTPKSEKTFSAAIARAVSRVLSKVNIRLGAAYPLKRAPGYDTSQSLRSAYKDMIQPPDMKGMYQNLPRFNEGGEVTGGSGRGIDDVLALLSKGEIILPADIADKLKAMAAAAFDSSSAIGKSEDMDVLTDVVSALVREMGKLKAQNIDGEFEKAAKSVDKMDDSMDDLTETVEEANTTFGRLFQKTFGPAQFLAIQRSVDDLQRAFGSFEGSARDAFGQVAGGEAPVMGFIESLNEANVKLDLSRSELAIWKEDLLDIAANSKNLGPQQIGQAFKALTDAGVTNRDLLMESVEAVSVIAETTGTGFEEAAKQVYKLRNAYEFTNEQVLANVANVKLAAKTSAISSEELLQQQEKNLDNLGAFLLRLDSVEERANAMRGLNNLSAAMAENWGEAGGSITDVITQALSGSQEARQTLDKLTGGIGLKELESAAKSGRMDVILERMTSHMESLAGSGEHLAEVQNLINFNGTAAEFAKTIKAGPAMLKHYNMLTEGAVAAANSNDAMAQSLENNTTGFERFKRNVSGFLASSLGAGVLEFFEDFNVQAAFATARLAQMSVEFGSAAVKAIFFRKASKGVSTSVSKTTQATTQLSKTARGGAGGGMIGGFLRGIAGGFAAFANPKVIVGMGAVVLAIMGLAGAARIASPVLTELFGVFERLAGKAIEMFERVFLTITELDPKHALASASAMLMLGPALYGMGLGIAGFGNLAMIGVPGLIAFSKVMGKFGADSMNPIAASIETLFDMFQFDQTKMKRAVSSISGAALFMAQLAGVTVAFGLLRTVAFFQKANPLEGLSILFGQGGTIQMLIDHAKSITRTMTALADHFGNVKDSVIAKVEKAAPVFEALGKFSKSYAEIVAAFAGIKITAVMGKFTESVVQVFTKKTGLMHIMDNAKSIQSTVSKLAREFTPSKVDTKSLKDTLPIFESLAEFIGSYAKIVGSFDEVKPGAFERIAEFYMDFYGIDSPMEAMNKQISTIQEVVTNTATNFSILGKTVDKDMLEKATTGINRSMELLDAFKPVVEKTDELNTLSKSLQSGLWDELVQLFGADSPLENLKEVLVGTDDADGIIGVISSIGTFLAETTTKWKGIGTGGLYKQAAIQANKISMLSFEVFDAAKNMVKAEEHANTFMKGPSKGSIENIKSVLRRLRDIAGALFDPNALKPVKDLKAEVDMPLTSKAQIEKVVRVELDPNTTDRPVLSATQETNMLLTRILTAVQGGGTTKVVQSTPGAVKDTPSKVREFARGND